MSTPTLPPIATFADVMSQAMAFEEEFGECHAALVVDDRGEVRDGVVLTAGWHTVDHALSYVLLGDRCPGEHVLLFSAMGKVDITVLSEADLDAYESLGARCRNHRLHLADWVIAGDGHYRTMQLASSPPPLDAPRQEPGDVWRL